MKKLVYTFMLLGAIGLSACEDEKEEENNGGSGGNGGGGGSVSVENNTVVAGSDKGTITKYSAYTAQDANSGGAEYIELYCYDTDILNSSYDMKINITQIPAASTTLTWQDGSNAPGAIGPNEFIVQVKVNDAWWYAPFTADGYDVTGDMQVTVNGDKITFAFEDITLADSFIVPSITERKACGGKVTLSLSELNGVASGSVDGDLMAE